MGYPSLGRIKACGSEGVKRLCIIVSLSDFHEKKDTQDVQKVHVFVYLNLLVLFLNTTHIAVLAYKSPSQLFMFLSLDFPIISDHILPLNMNGLR